MPTALIHVRLSQADLSRLEQDAAAEERSLAGQLHWALRQWLAGDHVAKWTQVPDDRVTFSVKLRLELLEAIDEAIDAARDEGPPATRSDVIRLAVAKQLGARS